MKKRPFEGKESLSLMQREPLLDAKKASLQIEERLSLFFKAGFLLFL